jgi:hypothetical protein
MKVSTPKPIFCRLRRAGLYLREICKGVKSVWAERAAPRGMLVSSDAEDAASRFFFIVVEVQAADTELIRLMQVNPSVAAAIQLPDGCRFMSCFEVSAEHARVVIGL